MFVYVYYMVLWYVCFDVDWKFFIICLQVLVKLKLKMWEDLLDKEIIDISVSSISFFIEFLVYFQLVQFIGCIQMYYYICGKVIFVFIVFYNYFLMCINFEIKDFGKKVVV